MLKQTGTVLRHAGRRAQTLTRVNTVTDAPQPPAPALLSSHSSQQSIVCVSTVASTDTSTQTADQLNINKPTKKQSIASKGNRLQRCQFVL